MTMLGVLQDVRSLIGDMYLPRVVYLSPLRLLPNSHLRLDLIA